MLKFLRSKKGFTLVELMVVCIIVAILAAVAIPLMSANKKRAYETEAQSTIGMIRTNLRVYYAEHGTYATATFANLGITGTDLAGTYFGSAAYTLSGLAATTYTVNCTWVGGTGTTLPITAAPHAADLSSYTTKTTTIDQDGTWGGTA